MPEPADGKRERDPFGTFMWHVPLIFVLAAAVVMLPGAASGALAVAAGLGWLAGSSVVRAP